MLRLVAGDQTRLSDAVRVSLGEHLEPLGYRLQGSRESSRGGWVELTNGVVLVTVHADWLEGELGVEVGVGGSEPVPIDHLVSTLGANGLRFQWLPRSVRTEVIASQLSKVANLLTSEAADVLAGTEDGLARLRSATTTPPRS